MFLENKIIDYTENEEDIKHWITLKGEYRYLIIIDVMKKYGITTTWENVTNIVKYDKRLLINIFKYIVFLEEYIKSIIFRYNKTEKDKILKYEFRKALNEFIAIPNIQLYDNMNIELMKVNSERIIQFRNSVVHNKILVGQLFEKQPLKSMIDIYSRILPESYRKGFKKDIIDCDKDLNVARYCMD